MAQKWRAPHMRGENITDQDNKDQSSSRKTMRGKPSISLETLNTLALRYVARYATTRGKLSAYLLRKLSESLRQHPDLMDEMATLRSQIDGIVDRMETLGYVNDAQWAHSMTDSMTRRGYGANRVQQKLRHASIDPQIIETVLHDDDHQQHAEQAAIRFAKRHKLGPFSVIPQDPAVFRKAIAKMLRAGHPYDISYKTLKLHVINTDMD